MELEPGELLMRDAEANDMLMGDPGHGRGQLGRLQGCRVGLGNREAYWVLAGNLMEKQTLFTRHQRKTEREAVWRKEWLGLPVSRDLGSQGASAPSPDLCLG